MQAVRERWNAFAERFMSYGRRERLMMTLAVVVVLLLGGWQLLVTPSLVEKQAMESRLASLSDEVRALEDQRRSLKDQLSEDPNEPLRKRRSQLQQRLERYNQELEALTTGLVSPTEMVALLREMLAEHDGITLVSVSHEPAEPVALGGNTSDGENAGLYSHPVSVTVGGSFHEILDYLGDLEALDERLGWRSLDYQVSGWPDARVQIRLHTLSLHEEWLGV
ncbi:MSHA biogenesis protein MshJ [Halospina denitrificans]|uniref:MSHA biogenesis protein MshJ n=1 Tax=Halospina denitrificans TaxID=332522 RepID=A0A4V3EPB9_9GAMM|nr:type II secretion system protein M [Halospina denitrificans]TDT36978.1 MSHA biogenesis protein MshJ [Halospina denitrificans]